MQALHHIPRTQATRSNKPLAVSLFLSTAITAAILSVISIPQWDVSPPLTIIVLERDTESPEQAETTGGSPLPEQVARDAVRTAVTDGPTEHTLPDDRSEPTIDSALDTPIEWYAVLDEVVEHLSGEANHKPSMSPQLDELRRVAKLRFAPVVDRGPRPIWENVEKDQMGRTILRAGDCYRVLEDWRVTNRWAQENFGQYIVYCETHKPSPQELPFVAQIIERYDYLNGQ